MYVTYMYMYMYMCIILEQDHFDFVVLDGCPQMTCPEDGFVGQDCKCWCKGSPTRPCDEPETRPNDDTDVVSIPRKESVLGTKPGDTTDDVSVTEKESENTIDFVKQTTSRNTGETARR